MRLFCAGRRGWAGLLAFRALGIAGACWYKDGDTAKPEKEIVEIGSSSVDIITVHGREHVVIINGCPFELAAGTFDPAIRKIEWAAGRGVIYWEDAAREPSTFDEEGFRTYLAPLVRAFEREAQRVEDNVVILDRGGRPQGMAAARERAAILQLIREEEEKMTRSTQAILAAQLAGKIPDPEDVRHFLGHYTKKLELRAQIAALDSEL